MKKRKKPATRALPSPLPPPGLSGDYRGSCVVCLRGTETALAVSGPAEAAVGVLMALGVEKDAASNTLAAAHGCDPSMVPCGEGPWLLRLCSDCASPLGRPVGDPRIGVPCITPGAAP